MLVRLFTAGPFDALRRRWAASRVKIFLYHQVTPSEFSDQLAYLRKTCTFVSLREVWQALEDGTGLPANSAVITFDDGWRSNFDLLPVIRQYGCPVTIFAAMGLVGTNRRVWHTVVSRRENYRLQKLPDQERLDELQTQHGYSPEADYEKREMLNLDEMEAMSGDVDFQSHGMFHPVLPMCSPETLGYELEESKKRLEHRFGREVFAFAYPHGRAGFREALAAQVAGYRLARMSGHQPGVADLRKDPMLLPAIGIREGMSRKQFREEIAWGEIRSIFGRAHRYR